MKARTLTLCLALSLAAAAPLFAGGQGEPRLSEAQRLIQIQDYSGALRLLAALQRQNPELEDETSRLISQVIITRGQMYNQVLSQLVKAVYVDNDQEKAVALLSELQRIDPTRSPPGIDFVKFQNLMNRAAILLAAGETADALALYVLPFTDTKKAGFAMPDIDATGYGPIIRAAVEDSASRIFALGSQEVKAVDEIDRIPLTLDSYLSKQPGPGAIDEFNTIVSPLLEAARAEGVLRAVGASLADMNRSMQETSGKNRPDQYLGWLTLGREKKTEGIVEAVRRLWVDRALGVASRTFSAAVTAFQSAQALYLTSRLDEAASAFDAAASRGTVAAKGAGLAVAALATTASSGWALTEQDSRTMKNLLLFASTGQEDVAEAGAYRNLIAYKKELAALPAADPEASVDNARAAAETAQLLAYRSRIQNRSSDADAAEKEWEGRAADWTSKARLGVPFDPLSLSAKRVAEEYQSFAASDLAAKDLQYALRLGRLGSRDFPSRLAAAQALRVQAQDLADGTTNGQPPSGGVAKREPLKALPMLEDEVARLEGLLQDATDLGQKLRAEKPYVLASVGLTRLFTGTPQIPGLDPLTEAIQAERAAADRALAAAQKNLDDAAIASKDGDNNYVTAKNALEKGDPVTAALFADKANESYVLSQTIAYTDHAAQMTDKDIVDLKKGILKKQAENADKKVRDALPGIDKKVALGDYLGASDDLEKAQATWDAAQTGSTNPYLEIRRENIQNALQGTAGVELSRLDPKADVVNTFVKYARDNLAKNRIAEAEQNVNYALNVAPNYRAARVLALTIKKTTDPSAFKAAAAQAIAKYIKDATDAKSKDDLIAAYNGLNDYASLDPKFAADTKNIRDELAYSLNYKPRPPSAKDVAESNDLVQQADQLQQQGTAEAWQAALKVLTQALAKNRNNKNAGALITLIQDKIRNVAQGGFSAEDGQKYRQALGLYLSGAYQDAYDKVRELWDSNQTNKRIPDLIRLRKRCEVALNIS
jgi:hypothetical protein